MSLMDNDLPKILRLAFLLCVCGLPVLAQNNQVAFGRISEIGVGSSVTGIVTGDFNADRKTDLCVFGPSHISLLHNTGPDRFSSVRSFRMREGVEKAVTLDFNRDGLTDVVSISIAPRAINAYLNKRDTLTLVWTEEVPFAGENIIGVDANGDRVTDIVLFGKKTLGCFVWLGRGNGVFHAQRPLFEEYSFSRLFLTDLNGDRIIDAVAYDWVNNALLIFSGIGRMRFSAPSAIPVTSDLADIALLDVNTDGNIDVIALYRDAEEIHVFLGDGLGHFMDAMSASLSSIPSKIIMEDVNNDGREDALVFSENERSISVYFNGADTSSMFHQHITYSAGLRPIDATAFHSPGAHANLAVLEKDNRSVVVYHDVEYSPIADTEQMYALGLSPMGIATYDVNGDRKPDLLITNRESEHVSLFINRGDGTFFGQIPITAERYADAVDPRKKNDSTLICFLTHSSVDRLSMDEITYPSLSVQRSSVSTGFSPRILLTSYNPTDGSNSFLLRTRSETGSTIAISQIREIQRNRFVEQPFYQLPGYSIWAADVCDMNKDGALDVIILSTRTKRKDLLLGLSRGRFMDGFSQPSFVNLPDTGIQRADIWCINLNDDSLADVIMQMHSRGDDYLKFAFGATDSSLNIFPERISQVSIKNHNDIATADIDGDGKKDLVILNDLTKMIQVFLAKAGEGFSKPNRLMSMPTGGGFVVSDLNGDHIPDYAVVYADPGILRIILGKE